MDGRHSYSRVVLEKSIVLSEIQKKQLSVFADSSSPNESCALLFGNLENDKALVNEIFFTKNIEESPVNFTISNEELLEGYKIAEEKKLDVVGIFHSHPHFEAIPSSTDKKFMQSNPVIWVIYSGESKNFRAYYLDSDVIQVPII